MNDPLHSARLTIQRREQIVACVVAGQSAAAVTAAFAVSVRTMRTWLESV
jgi:transposase